MINKNEIIKLASVLSLSVDTVEKDYVLGWLLWGINNDEELSKAWYFKGGTSLKKCFFETFRFSEDLDYTVTDAKHFSNNFLHKKLVEITGKIYDLVGIEFISDNFKIEVISKDNNKFSAEVKIPYIGPMQRRRGDSFPTIKFDLTNNEIIVLSPQKQKVHHPYSDEPKEGIWANCYAFKEVIAEKIRALSERARPRDLYDVIHFFRNREMISNPQLVVDVLVKKCSYKKIPMPNYSYIEKHEKIEELSSQWYNMLAHQLPSLPPLESFWQDLEPFFSWLEGNLKENHLVRQSDSDGEIFKPGRVVNAYSIYAVINKIQFAAANRVCIELLYHNEKRIVEPLSFRRSKAGDRLFYGYERDPLKLKAFTISKIQNVGISNLPYEEREYPIEINASGQIVMPPIRRNRK